MPMPRFKVSHLMGFITVIALFLCVMRWQGLFDASYLDGVWNVVAVYRVEVESGSKTIARCQKYPGGMQINLVLGTPAQIAIGDKFRLVGGFDRFGRDVIELPRQVYIVKAKPSNSVSTAGEDQ